MAETPEGLLTQRPTFRQHLEATGVSIAAWIIQRLPLRSLPWFARVLGALVYSVDARGRNVALSNLESAFGEELTLSKKKEIARGSYQSFARTMIELLWSPNLTREVVARNFRTEGIPASKPGEPCIYLTTHSANFEWLGQNLAYQIGPGIVIAQQLKNPLLAKIFDRLRGSTGHTIIPQERALARMLAHLRAGGYFCVVVDLNLDPKEASVVVDQFSGLKTCVTQIHAALARHTGAKIVPSECIPMPDGTHVFQYGPPLEINPDASPSEIAQQCWDVLEKKIRQRPGNWLWMYKHWRFRPAGEGMHRYPPYSNVAKRFDSLLKKQNSDTPAGSRR